MSLYNMLFGVNDDADVLLGMLSVNMEYFKRFRDIDLINNGKNIRVTTRLGDGNRKAYEDTWGEIKCHSLYLKDYDDDLDSTYAYIEFNIPEKFKKLAQKMYKGEPMSFSEKFKKELSDMEKEGSEANKRAEKIADMIMGAIDNGDNFIGL